MCTNNVWILAFVLLCSNNLRRSDLRRWIKLLEMKNWWFLTSCCCTTLLHQMNGDNVEILMFLFFFVLSAMWHLIPELCYSTRHTLFIVTLFTTITFMYQPEWDPPSSLSPVYLNLRSKLRLNKYWLHKHTFQLSSNPHKNNKDLFGFDSYLYCYQRNLLHLLKSNALTMGQNWRWYVLFWNIFSNFTIYF